MFSFSLGIVHAPHSKSLQIARFSSIRREFAKAARGVGLLRDEASYVKGLLYRGGLRDHDKHVITKTAKDFLRVIPVLGALALPGGSLLVPAMAKLMPWALPSTFTYVERDPNPEPQSTMESVDFQGKTKQALKDLRQRLHAQPAPNEELVHQLDEFNKNPELSRLSFHNFYAMSEQNILNSLDTDLVEKIARRLRLVVGNARDELIQSILGRVSRIRSSDLAMQDAIESHSTTPSEIADGIKLRSLDIAPGEDPTKLMSAWLDVTVVRSMPVALALMAVHLEEGT